MLLIVLGGVAVSATVYAVSETAYRSQQKELTATIAASIQTTTTQKYQAISPEDISDQLQNIQQANPNIATLYMAVKTSETTQVVAYPSIHSYQQSEFVPDPQAATQLISRADDFANGYIMGPNKTDTTYGIMVYAPLYSPDSKQIIGVLGTQFNSQAHYMSLVALVTVPLIITLAALFILLKQLRIQSKEQAILALKNQFVSIASHELRSPLTGILWAVQSLSHSASSKLTLSQLGLLTDIYRSAESSLATVNEILDMSIFERGKDGNLPHDNFDLWMVIKQVEATLRLGAQEKNILIEPTGSWPKHVPVIGDANALKRAIMNIISNAIKYSPDNSTIELRYIHSTENQHIIGVQDSGIGIPPDEQQQVLEGYYRASNARHVQANGTGLGLWVTRKIVEEHGGKLWLESELGKGTTIYLSLPKNSSGTTNTKSASHEVKKT